MIRFFVLAFLIINLHLNACNRNCLKNSQNYNFKTSSIEKFDYATTHGCTLKSPNRLFLKIKKQLNKSDKVTAAVLAFPIPFGIVGLHRIYLGTQPYVPVVYIATVGGCFGILPLIDFFSILLQRNSEEYVNNSHVFMWAK